MKTIPLFTLGLLLCNLSATAANVSVTFDPQRSNTTLDSNYTDGETAIFQATVSDARIVATLGGADYVQDPFATQEWGLLDNSKPWNDGRPGWLVRQGWESTVEGIPTNNHPDGDIPAAYLVLKISRPDDLMFESISVIVDNPNSVEFVVPWASSNADDFQSFVSGATFITPDEESVTWTFSNLNYTGNEPLEVRLYGILGEDDGTFGIEANLTVSTIVPVPEPSVTTLVLAALGMGLRRRTRRK